MCRSVVPNLVRIFGLLGPLLLVLGGEELARRVRASAARRVFTGGAVPLGLTAATRYGYVIHTVRTVSDLRVSYHVKVMRRGDLER